jgi:hypothetical protein
MKIIINTLLYISLALLLVSCHRADEDQDVISQEEISNVILLVHDNQTGITKTYNYTANATENPLISLENGKEYTVDVVFKNGNEDLNSEILEAKDEHFLIFQFIDAQIQLTRLSGANDTRSDGNKIGMKTKWKINAINSPSAKLNLTLNHAAISVSEAENNFTYGSVEGGETDAEAVYNLSN